MTALKLRPYQEEALAELEKAWTTTTENRLAVVLPTGMGKTVIFSRLVDLESQRGVRTLILVHRDELVRQAVAKIRSAAPHLSVGVIKAECNETTEDVVVASVQSLSRPKRLAQIQPWDFGCIIVDECHHAVANSYVTILEHFDAFRGYNPEIDRVRVAGFTATMARGDSRGLGDVWQRVVYTRDLSYGIMHGYLCDVSGKAVHVDNLDLGSVARSGGDYQDGALGDALIESGAGEIVASAYLEHAEGRQGVLFAPDVRSTIALADDFNRAGIVTEVILGSTPAEDRQLIFKRYEAGDTRVLANCMVLTEGWDMPQAKVAIIARPTTSQSLYIQMAGRVLRPFPRLGDALILDVVGVSSKLALASMIDLTETNVKPEPGESLAEAIVREEKERLAELDPANRKKISGSVGFKDVDLFHNSTSVWLQTPNGCWFIDLGGSQILFLWPDSSTTFKIGTCSTRDPKGTGQWHNEKSELGYAMAWGEQLADTMSPVLSAKTASWRKRRQRPSDSQRDLAASFGIPFDDDTSKSELSDAISIFFAARILDRGARKS